MNDLENPSSYFEARRLYSQAGMITRKLLQRGKVPEDYTVYADFEDYIVNMDSNAG